MVYYGQSAVGEDVAGELDLVRKGCAECEVLEELEVE